MAINLRHILARIEEMGVETAIKKLESYEVHGPSSDEFFGADCIHNLTNIINEDNLSEVSDGSYSSEELKYSFNMHVTNLFYNNCFDNSIPQDEYYYSEYYNSTPNVLHTSEFSNDNISELDYSKAA